MRTHPDSEIMATSDATFVMASMDLGQLSLLFKRFSFSRFGLLKKMSFPYECLEMKLTLLSRKCFRLVFSSMTS